MPWFFPRVGPLSSGSWDFTIPAHSDPEEVDIPIELVFEVADSRLNISFELLEDLILEPTENFRLLLSVPANPAVNQLSGSTTQATVTIQDNEGVCVYE